MKTKFLLTALALALLGCAVPPTSKPQAPDSRVIERPLKNTGTVIG